MTALARDVRRLLVECGLAAVNHGLARHAWAIYDALPALVADPADRRLVEATMLIGLGRDGPAARLLASMPGPEAALLRGLLAPTSACVSAHASTPVAAGARSPFPSEFARSLHGHHRRATRATDAASDAANGRDADRPGTD
ncbi:EscG/YscG/SsaH family type III secretion system needle protein co-chaperone [Burkholderia oklahomensis]|uniref:EscG/YscG/SsaH family type III secretion system needle protein co-chaperone n=1 Tax=Burkholderia oklahomensis TaxID=342113 RepID=UPI00264F5014|nr:EscG/YscG/SsaH family type III secretion system needle protein co-chaperone [Burkholderia oklahomensis]MDN7673338.1 EscG/YscG/SsaH family type III secretion system needle protein co-chaperone [Burkholderia oklahomensis]